MSIVDLPWRVGHSLSYLLIIDHFVQSRAEFDLRLIPRTIWNANLRRSEHAMNYLVDTLVIGAGPAGLQLGYYLKRNGRDYLILEYAQKVGVRPTIGMRVKLASRGSGKWQSSGGYRSKFGLTVSEVLKGFEELKALGMQDCLKLLHFHMGSQIPNIRIVKAAINEAARIYSELVKAGAGLRYLDIGGGLGVDYD
ncbi:MAG: NAD(P)-binding protein, partial [Chloroflexi bacterium]|nr:NAD(P)-binding protein [Chloroflexota bacterium]